MGIDLQQLVKELRARAHLLSIHIVDVEDRRIDPSPAAQTAAVILDHLADVLEAALDESDPVVQLELVRQPSGRQPWYRRMWS